ncbi:uncharacterized protein [Lepisosteus oculatus]|uniref:uncharacterized protein isoform X2 n=1 Tax=Lepisosteus oculatus TaxID=7918 RepID=UPI0035F5301C
MSVNTQIRNRSEYSPDSGTGPFTGSLTLCYGHPLKLPLPPGSQEVEIRTAGLNATLRLARLRPGCGFEVWDGRLLRRSLTWADAGLYTVWARDDRGLRTTRVEVKGCTVNVTLQPGANLSVPLYAATEVEVLFEPVGEGNVTSVYAMERGQAVCHQQYRRRILVDDETLTLAGVTRADQGEYRVKDTRTNFVLSRVIVTVQGPTCLSVFPEESPAPERGPADRRQHLGVLLLFFPPPVLLGAFYVTKTLRNGRRRAQGGELRNSTGEGSFPQGRPSL